MWKLLIISSCLCVFSLSPVSLDMTECRTIGEVSLKCTTGKEGAYQMKRRWSMILKLEIVGFDSRSTLLIEESKLPMTRLVEIVSGDEVSCGQIIRPRGVMVKINGQICDEESSKDVKTTVTSSGKTSDSQNAATTSGTILHSQKTDQEEEVEEMMQTWKIIVITVAVAVACLLCLLLGCYCCRRKRQVLTESLPMHVTTSFMSLESEDEIVFETSLHSPRAAAVIKPSIKID